MNFGVRFVAAFALFCLLGCPSLWGVIHVSATTSLVADMVKVVGGQEVRLTSLMGPGVDPHLYKATASDVNKLRNADLIFYNGLHLEGRMTEIFEQLKKQGKPVYAICDSIDRQKLRKLNAAATEYDPHVWFDPRLWADCVDTVVNALSRHDAVHAKDYQARGADLKSQYQQLFEWGHALCNDLPKERRILITSHDAYNYFGDAFHFQVVGVQGVSTVSEAGLADIVSMIDFINKNKVKAIFVESSVSPAATEKISEGAHVTIGGELFSDALGVPGEKRSVQGKAVDVGTYVGMFQYNFNTICSALR